MYLFFKTGNRCVLINKSQKEHTRSNVLYVRKKNGNSAERSLEMQIYIMNIMRFFFVKYHTRVVSQNLHAYLKKKRKKVIHTIHHNSCIMLTVNVDLSNYSCQALVLFLAISIENSSLPVHSLQEFYKNFNLELIFDASVKTHDFACCILLTSNCKKNVHISHFYL